jgi:hypothetical protein
MLEAIFEFSFIVISLWKAHTSFAMRFAVFIDRSFVKVTPILELNLFDKSTIQVPGGVSQTTHIPLLIRIIQIKRIEFDSVQLYVETSFKVYFNVFFPFSKAVMANKVLVNVIVTSQIQAVGKAFISFTLFESSEAVVAFITENETSVNLIFRNCPQRNLIQAHFLDSELQIKLFPIY